MSGRWRTALFALAFAVFGVLVAVYAFSGEDTYRDLARGRAVTFVTPTATWTVDEGTLVTLHRQTLAYVLGGSGALPNAADGRPLFDESESGHLADVRAVFGAVRLAAIVSGLAAVALLAGTAAWPRLLRDGAALGAVGILALALVFALAFEPAFLAFHYVFFPQGNFLFDPATSNLLRLYPESYWYGVTMRVGAGFVTGALILALSAHMAMRRDLT